MSKKFKVGDKVRLKVMSAKEAYQTAKEAGKKWFGWMQEMTDHAERGTIFIVWDDLGNTDKIPIREHKEGFSTPEEILSARIFHVIEEWIQPESAPRKFVCKEPWEVVRAHGCQCGAITSEMIQKGYVWCKELRMWVKP